MKTIGLIGGMSWESSLEYYRLINNGIKERLGGLHSAEILMYSVNFEEIVNIQKEERWDDGTAFFKKVVAILKNGGADFFLICTNTMHMMADELEAASDIPLLHIADAAAIEIKRRGFRKLGLLGTSFTMERDFYRRRLAEKYDLEIIVPEKSERQYVNDVIFQELCRGIRLEQSRRKYMDIIAGLETKGAEGVILGCTEIGMLLKDGDCDIPLFDTTILHASAAVEYALTH